MLGGQGGREGEGGGGGGGRPAVIEIKFQGILQVKVIYLIFCKAFAVTQDIRYDGLSVRAYRHHSA